MARPKPNREKLGLTGTVPTGEPVVMTTPERVAAMYQECFGTSSGQAVLADLKKRYGNRRSFVPGNDGRTEFNEGQRDVYLLILGFIEYVNRKPQTQENDD